MTPAMCETIDTSMLKTLCSKISGSGIKKHSMDAMDDIQKSQYHFQDIEKPAKNDFQLPFKVRMHDLDLNGHVNNAIFVEWAVETVPEEILSRYTPMTIDVIFNKESLYGDTIVSITDLCNNTQLENPFTRHTIIRKEDGVELANLNIKWRVNEASFGILHCEEISQLEK